MTAALRALLAAAMLAFGLGAAAYADDDAVYVVSYVEVLPKTADIALALLKVSTSVTAIDDGMVSSQLLQQVGAPDHFVILEVWKNAKARESDVASAKTKAWRDSLAALLASPYDERLHVALAVGVAKPIGLGAAKAGAATVFGVTHVDCVGARKDDCMAQLRDVSTPSRGEAGNLRFDAVQQANRPNHFTIISAWRDEEAAAAHIAAAHTMRFRATLHPMTGSPYDERLYKPVD
jgi:quinol monooxygenase YgiN